MGKDAHTSQKQSDAIEGLSVTNGGENNFFNRRIIDLDRISLNGGEDVGKFKIKALKPEERSNYFIQCFCFIKII